MKYAVIVECFEPVFQEGEVVGVKAYPIESDTDIYEGEQEAFDAAYNDAEAECEEWNSGCNADRSFGIPVNEDDFVLHRKVIVECYTNTDDTYPVTVRHIVPVYSYQEAEKAV